MLCTVEALRPTRIPKLAYEGIATRRRNAGRLKTKWRQEHSRRRSNPAIAHTRTSVAAADGDNGVQLSGRCSFYVCDLEVANGM